MAAPEKRPRRKRKLLYGIAALATFLILLTVLAPTFVSWGLGQGLIRGSIEQNINGRVALGDVKLGWFGHQAVRDLTVSHANGKQAARMNVSIERGLLGLIFGSADPVVIKVSGDLNGQIKEGKLSFGELLRQDSATPQAPPTPKPREPFRFPEIPGVALHIDGVDLAIENLDTNQTIKLDDLKGKFSYVDPTMPITLDLHGKSTVDGVAGSIDITGQGDGLFDSDRRISLSNASAKFDVQVNSLPLALPNDQGRLDSMSFSIASDDLTGTIIATLNATGTPRGREPASLKLDASVNKVLTSRGELSLRGGAANINAQASNLPIIAEGVNGTIESFSAAVISPDLTSKMSVGLEGSTKLENFDPSPLHANLSIDQPFSSEGRPQFALDRITGRARGDAIPVALLEPVLAGSETLSKINMSRDIGPTISVNAEFSAGERRDMTLNVVGEKARLELTANVQTNDATAAITGSHLLLASPAAQPELVRDLLSINIDRPTPFEIRLNRFVLPPAGDDGVRPKSKMAATGTLVVVGPTSLQMPSAGEAQTIGLQVQNLKVNIDSPKLGDHLDAQGSANVDGADVTFEHRITNLFDSQGNLAVMSMLPAGTINVQNLNADTFAKFAPERKELIKQIVGPGLETSLITTADGSNLIVELNANSAAIESRLNAVKRADSLTVQGGIVTMRVTPELAAAAQQDSENPVELAQAATVTLDVQQVDFTRAADGSFELADQPTGASLSINDLVLQRVPGLAEPVAVQEFVAQLGMQREGSFRALTAIGDVILKRPQAESVFARARYNMKLSQRIGSDEPMIPHIDVGLADLSVLHLEQLIAMEPGTISQWTGDQGELSIHVEKKDDAYHGNVRAGLPHLKGDFTARSDGEIVALTAQTSSLILSRQAIENRLNPPADRSDGPTTPSSPQSQPRIQMAEDVPLTLAVKQLQFPLAMLGKKPIHPDDVDIDLKLAGGPIVLINPGDVRTELSDLDIAIQTANLSEGVAFSMRGKAEAAGGSVPQPVQQPEGTIGRPATDEPMQAAATQPQSGTIDVTGKLVDLLGENNTIQPATAKLEMKADIRTMPSAVADAFADMQGLLVAAVGPVMDAKFTADDFSVNSGTLDARITTPNGWLEAPLRGREFAIRTVRDQSIKAELAVTPALRDRLLQKIHPILADVRTTENPLSIELPLLMLPVNEKTKSFDIDRMRADINIKVGKVELDSGSQTLSVLRFFGEEDDRRTIPGEIEPIVATIRNGVVKYEKFAVHLDKYTLNYVGEINLVKRTVDLRTEVPLRALGESVKELEPYSDKIVVPLVTRGKFGSLKTEIDPDFDMGKAALEAGFRGGLEQLLEGEGGLLDELLRRKKKKPE